MALRSIPLLGLSLLFLSCQPPGAWHKQEMLTNCQDSDSIRLTYPPESPSEGFELEFLIAKQTLTTHINLLLYPLPFTLRTEYPLTLQSEKETFTYPAYIHKGGQKLTLSQKAQDCLLSLLETESQIHISFQGHSQTIFSTGFKKYEKLLAK